MSPPFVVVEGPEAALDHAVRETAAAGWIIVPGFAAPRGPGRAVRTGVIAGPTDAEAALLAALAGEGLVVLVSVQRESIDRLVDDLRRLGPVDHRIGPPPEPPSIGPESLAILGLLAQGHSLGEAAGHLGLSRRTADRRLAEGRRALGTDRTTEAIARARRLGWLDPTSATD